MNTHRTAVAIFITSFALGLAGNFLLRNIPWGINALLWTTSFAIIAVTLLQTTRKQPWTSVLLPAIGAIAAAFGIFWRDAPELNAIDGLLIVPLLALLALGPRDVRLWATGIVRIVVALFVTAAQSIAGVFKLPFDLTWKQVPVGRASRTAGTLLRGTVIAIPALLIFGALLMSADEAFASLVRDVFFIDLTDTMIDIIVTIVIAAACAGFFRSILMSDAWMPPWTFEIKKLRAGDTNVAIALVDLLFALFVGVQFRYLFGGSSLVKVTANMTYAEYARSGFFELVVVTVLVVPMLLAVEWIVDKSDPHALRTFRILASLQIALVLVIAASAYQRMRLYRDEFGLTQLRVYATAFMLWMLVLLLWLAATVLTGHRAQFAIGLLVTGLIALVSVHAIDPHALIVRTNARLTHRAFDVKYAKTLSADAAPELVKLNDPCIARSLLTADAHRPHNWRAWNLARSRAHAAVEEHRAELIARAAACP
ncbi:MAG TPA: DUF4173 domain-containing protein [Thermoanaerobaculia bacterium]|nr:DUF4173 domain-containing protein [Thermoanaerobaculia bacterium]